MPRFLVTYTFGATIPVDAANEEEAANIVEEMAPEELFEAACDGLEIQNVESE